MDIIPSINVKLDVEHEQLDAVRRLLDRQTEHYGSVKDAYDPETNALRGLIHSTEPFEMGVLTDGTSEGRPTIFLAFTLPDGRVLLQETTLRLLQNAATIIRTRYPDESTDALRSDLADIISAVSEDNWETTLAAVFDRLGIAV